MLSIAERFILKLKGKLYHAAINRPKTDLGSYGPVLGIYFVVNFILILDSVVI